MLAVPHRSCQKRSTKGANDLWIIGHGDLYTQFLANQLVQASI